jgi:hypothetical protein
MILTAARAQFLEVCDNIFDLTRGRGDAVLQIRTAQLKALAEDRRKLYIEQTTDHLLKHFSDCCKAAFEGGQQVRAFVASGVDKASILNVNTPTATTALLELWLQFGSNFERSPARTWTMNILSHPELPGAAKIDAIRERHLKLTGGCVMVVS